MNIQKDTTEEIVPFREQKSLGPSSYEAAITYNHHGARGRGIASASTESVEPLGGRLGVVCTAKASGISREAAKSGCACESGGWGRISEDGIGQQNPLTEVLQRAMSPGTERGFGRVQRGARRTEAN